MEEQMQSILIIGCGYLGSHLANYFNQKKWNVTIVGKKSTYEKHLDKNVTFKELDINTFVNFETLIKPGDTVLYAIGSINATNTFNDLEKDILNNYIPFLKLLDHCFQNKISKFVFLSSAGTVYGDSDKYATEDDCLNPVNIYGLQKLYFENLIKIKQYETNRFPFLILRVSNPYGGIQNPQRNQGIIPVLIDKISNSEEFVFWGDTAAVRDFIYIDDFLEATYRSVMNVSNEIVNISSGVCTSISTVIQTVEEVMDSSVYLTKKASTNKTLMKNKVDNTKMSSLTGYHPSISLKQGIEKMIFETLR
ncbi:NAD-dependent epimerase/dehydratase family protein [Saccharibacillus brassicae]|nr:NAD-dependent epimerase/dehydratase family protein [Saccharibacillus brassicae]